MLPSQPDDCVPKLDQLAMLMGLFEPSPQIALHFGTLHHSATGGPGCMTQGS